jgi:hypothetical protein
VTASPLVADRLAAGIAELGRRIEAASHQLGHPVRWAWHEIPHQRTRLRRMPKPGRATASGAGRLLGCADGWVAVQLPRRADVELVPAWLGLVEPDGPGPVAAEVADDGEVWPHVEAAVARIGGQALVDAAALVGLAVARLAERSPAPDGGVVVHHPRVRSVAARPTVVDLSALWAGPLCGAVLAAAGAQVTKVESTTRPDGARTGDPQLHAELNRAKAHHRLDLTTPTGRAELAQLISDADVVIESSRPRALEQLGIVAADALAASDGPALWVSITGHGRASARIAFGDDAAVAGGLVDHAADGPRFLGDAVADPLSGLAAAAAALELLVAGRGGLVEVTMAAVAAAHREPEALR